MKVEKDIIFNIVFIRILRLYISVSFWSLVDSCLIGNHTTSFFFFYISMQHMVKDFNIIHLSYKLLTSVVIDISELTTPLFLLVPKYECTQHKVRNTMSVNFHLPNKHLAQINKPTLPL